MAGDEAGRLHVRRYRCKKARTSAAHQPKEGEDDRGKGQEGWRGAIRSALIPLGLMGFPTGIGNDTGKKFPKKTTKYTYIKGNETKTTQSPERSDEEGFGLS